MRNIKYKREKYIFLENTVPCKSNTNEIRRFKRMLVKETGFAYGNVVICERYWDKSINQGTQKSFNKTPPNQYNGLRKTWVRIYIQSQLNSTIEKTSIHERTNTKYFLLLISASCVNTQISYRWFISTRISFSAINTCNVYVYYFYWVRRRKNALLIQIGAEIVWDNVD